MFCENCNKEHTGLYGSGRFCGVKCSHGYSTKNKRAEINARVSNTLTGRRLTEDHIKNIERANNFNRKEKTVRLCLECSAEIHCRPSNKKKFCNPVCWAIYTEKNKEPFLLYRQRANFTFNLTDFPDKFNLKLVEQYGLYSPANKGNNLNGVSRDHMLSVKDGFLLGIDPTLIAHPANCRIMLHTENQRKHSKSIITVDELLQRIQQW